MKALAFLLLAFAGGVLLYAERDFPAWGDPQSPASIRVSPHYLTETLRETATPNFVTAVLADYRGYDTLFESVVVLAAALCVLLLRRKPRPGGLVEGEEKAESHGLPPPDNNLIVQYACRLLLPVLQLFGLYVLAHGHISPGGGFQAGAILAAGFILLAITYNLEAATRILGEKTLLLIAASGVLLYALVGLVPMLLGSEYLNYSAWSFLPGLEPVKARYYGMLVVEIGVAFTVTAVLFGLYADLASRGRLDEGL